jgi:uncharacterized protein (TIGR03437 family)
VKPDGTFVDLVLNDREGATTQRVQVTPVALGQFLVRELGSTPTAPSKSWSFTFRGQGSLGSWGKLNVSAAPTSEADNAPITLLADGRYIAGSQISQSLNATAPFYERNLAPAVAVNAASYVAEPFNRHTLVAIFGQNFPARNAAVVKLKMQDGTYHNCKVIFSSVGQINIALNVPSIPNNYATAAELIVYQPDGEIPLAKSQIALTPLPSIGLFSYDGSGSSQGTTLILRVKQDGSYTYEKMYDVQPDGRFVTYPVDHTNQNDRIFLIVFCTGVDFADANNLSANYGGYSVKPSYAGRQGSIPGLSQINIELLRNPNDTDPNVTTVFFMQYNDQQSRPVTFRYGGAR